MEILTNNFGLHCVTNPLRWLAWIICSCYVIPTFIFMWRNREWILYNHIGTFRCVDIACVKDFSNVFVVMSMCYIAGLYNNKKKWPYLVSARGRVFSFTHFVGVMVSWYTSHMYTIREVVTNWSSNGCVIVLKWNSHIFLSINSQRAYSITGRDKMCIFQ